MKYRFPVIETIDDVLPAIEGRSEFVVAEREGHTIINYNLMMNDTFPDVILADPDDPKRAFEARCAMIRRECRGITFDSDGRIIRRPLHKFFNINERVEVQVDNLDLTTIDYIILDKLDGSMIAPYIIGDRMIFGTKMGDTDVAFHPTKFAHDNPNYLAFSNASISRNYTPIFEWCSRKQRIVIDHPEDQLILTAVRHMHSGEYMSYAEMKEIESQLNIPVVGANDLGHNINKIILYTKNLVDAEGFVIRTPYGHMSKAKSDWYVAIHKAKEAILWDRNIVELILDNNLDDVKAHLPIEDRDRIQKFEDDITSSIKLRASSIYRNVIKFVDDMKIDRKTFALEYAKHFDSTTKSLIFSLWDDNSHERAFDLVINTIRKNLTKNTNYNILRQNWFPNIKFNEDNVDG